VHFGDRNSGFKWLAFLGASALLGLAMIPLWQRLVMEISEIVIGKQTIGLLLELARSWEGCELVDFGRFSFLIAALLLLSVFWSSMASGVSMMKMQDRPWRLLVLGYGASITRSIRLRQNPTATRDFCWGLMMPLLLIGLACGYARWRGWAEPGNRVILFSIDSGMSLLRWWAFSIMIEIFLRGITLGLLLRSFGPITAIGLSTCIGFIGSSWQVPVGWTSAEIVSYAKLVSVVQSMTQTAIEPLHVLMWGLPTLLGGLVLGMARYRSASLWLPIGLHMGFIAGIFVATKCFTWEKLGHHQGWMALVLAWFIGLWVWQFTAHSPQRSHPT
jgi:hypothetical protein